MFAVGPRGLMALRPLRVAFDDLATDAGVVCRLSDRCGSNLPRMTPLRVVLDDFATDAASLVRIGRDFVNSNPQRS